MKIEAAHDLLSGVFRTMESVLRQRQARRRNSTSVRVNNKREDWMVIRRSGQLDDALAGGFGVRGQDFGNLFTLALYDKALIFEGVVPAFAHERSKFRFFEEKFVEPGDLREYLQIAEILREEKFLGALGISSRLAQALGDLGVAWIASDEVDRVRLEEVLQ